MEGDDKLWFHLACPTRIAKHKDGVCEAGSFDDLDNNLYVKSVKPAHSSFGVVSYDQKTDSTLLVRTNFATSAVHISHKILRIRKNVSSHNPIPPLSPCRFVDHILVERINFVCICNIWSIRSRTIQTMEAISGTVIQKVNELAR